MIAGNYFKRKKPSASADGFFVAAKLVVELFDRHGFGRVPRLNHVATAAHGDVICLHKLGSQLPSSFSKHPCRHATIVLHDRGFQRIDEDCIHLIC